MPNTETTETTGTEVTPVDSEVTTPTELPTSTPTDSATPKKRKTKSKSKVDATKEPSTTLDKMTKVQLIEEIYNKDAACGALITRTKAAERQIGLLTKENRKLIRESMKTNGLLNSISSQLHDVAQTLNIIGQ